MRQSTKFMERFTASWLKDYLALVSQVIEEGQRDGTLRSDLPRGLLTKAFFGILDEMVTSWVLSRRRYDLAKEAAPVVDLLLRGAGASPARPDARGRRGGSDRLLRSRRRAVKTDIRKPVVLGAGTMGAQVAAQAGGRRDRRRRCWTWCPPGSPPRDRSGFARRRSIDASKKLRPAPFGPPGARGAASGPATSRTTGASRRTQTGSSRRCSRTWRSSASSSPEWPQRSRPMPS